MQSSDPPHDETANIALEAIVVDCRATNFHSSPVKFPLAVAALAILLATTAPAALVFQLDPALETFTLTGSDTGTPNPPSSSGSRSAWSSLFNLTDASNTNLAITSAVGADSGIAFSPTSFLRIQGGATTPGYVIEIFTGNSNTQTITGNGTPISYAGLGADQKSDLERFVASPNNGQFMLAAGNNFSAITTQAVPEPSTVAFLAISLMAIVGVSAWRRRGAS